MERAESVNQLLDKRIASESQHAEHARFVGVAVMCCSILPLTFLVPCLIWVVPDDANPWTTVGVAAACLAISFAVWNIGAHFAKSSASRARRSRQLEDLQLYLMSVPEDEWPAKELLAVVITGRQPYFGDYGESSVMSSIEHTESD